MEAGNGTVTLPRLRRGVYILNVKSRGGNMFMKKVTVY
jgi:hypothetical protein